MNDNRKVGSAKMVFTNFKAGSDLGAVVVMGMGMGSHVKS
jgi:hypothetical protein